MDDTNDITLQLLLPRDQHEAYMTTSLKSAFATSFKADVVLVCESKKIRAHRAVLAAASPFFAHILQPLYYCDLIHVILDGFNPAVLGALVEFLYHGSTKIRPEIEEAFKELLVEFEIGSSTSLTTVDGPALTTVACLPESDPLQCVEEEDENEDDILDDGEIEGPNEDADFHPTSASKVTNNSPPTKRPRRAKPENDPTNETGSFPCETCGVAFSRRYTLKLHMRSHSDERPFVCTVCFKRFRQSGHLRTHERTHTGEKPFQCDVCNKFFTHASTLAEHKRLHDSVNIYSCNVCHRTFPQRRGLHKHSCGRSNTGASSIQCTKCSRSFPSTASFKAHYTQVHNSQSPTPAAGQDTVSYLCFECSEVVKTELELMRHTMEVHGAISYACRRCKTEHTTLPSFENHLCES